MRPHGSSRIDETRACIDELRRRSATLPPDPDAELIEWTTREQPNVREISFGFPLGFELLIGLISAISPAGIAYSEAAPSAIARQAMASLSALCLPVASPGKPARAMHLMAERQKPRSDIRSGLAR